MSQAPQTELFRRLDALVAEIEPQARKVRRHLHRYPEVGWKEHRTQRYLKGWLEEAGLAPRTVAETGLVVDIGEGGGHVIYRGDIDALPIDDGKQAGMTAVVSEIPGVSHACGHDMHAAVAAGLARVFSGLGDALPGPVRVVFQPAEEVLPSGAQAMLREGVAEGARAALALHVDPTRDTGTIGVRRGALTSTSDKFVIQVIGASGHAARPHLANDAILAASEVVQALYKLLGQRVNPVEPAVLGIGTIEGGETDNVVADRVVMSGNLRTLYTDTRERLHRELRRTAETAAMLYGCSAEVHFELGSPPTHNDDRLHALVKSVGLAVLGPAGVTEITVPSTGAEDFGQFSAVLPSYMMRLGVRSPGHPTRHLHTSCFDPDERALGVAMRVMGRAVIGAFDEISPYNGEA